MKKLKKILSIIVGVVILLTVGGIIVSLLQKNNLRDAIAHAVNADPSALILNIPPMPARFPGSIIAPRNKSFMIYTAENQNLEDIVKGEQFAVEATIKNLSEVGNSVGSNIISTAFNNNNHLEVSLKISNAIVLELPIDALKKLSKGNSSVVSALKRDLNPLIVNRSYFGNVEYIVKAKDAIGMDALVNIADMGYQVAKKRSGQFKFTDKIESNKEISFSIAKPIVFAFELMSIATLSTELSGENADISLTAISKQRVDALSKTRDSLSQGYDKKVPKWGLITISSAHYSYDATLNVPQATEGANLVEELFRQYRPNFVKRLRSTKDNVLTDEKILKWSIDLTQELLSNPVDHILIYYTGHGLSHPNGELLLLQGNINKDFAERAAEAINPQMAKNGDGIMLTQTLYSALGASGVPFTLLIDACYPNDEMQQALTRVSMSLGSRDGTNIHYYGQQALITNEMAGIADTISTIGQRFPYRLGNNALIFSSKPGATSVFRENPINPYGLELPPLASRMLRYSQYAQIEPDDQSIANVIRVNIDFINGVGEVGLDGSITWSNIKPMLSAFEHVYRE